MLCRAIPLALLLCGLGTLPAAADTVGRNGGVRLLLHVEPYRMPVGGIRVDPCSLYVPLEEIAEFTTDHAALGDTVRVWAYVYAPREMALCGIGFAIEYEQIDFITSGACSPMVGQDPEVMGIWPESGSELACVWMQDDPLTGHLAPVAWFVLSALDERAYFAVGPGQSPFSGVVGDDSVPPRENRIWDYGSIGFGSRAGKLPVPDPNTMPGSSGAVEVSLH
jgi:hypothetical protein